MLLRLADGCACRKYPLSVRHTRVHCVPRYIVGEFVETSLRVHFADNDLRLIASLDFTHVNSVETVDSVC